jgi:hypothetical protein
MAKKRTTKPPKNNTFHGGGGSSGESIYETAATKHPAKYPQTAPKMIVRNARPANDTTAGAAESGPRISSRRNPTAANTVK